MRPLDYSLALRGKLFAGWCDMRNDKGFLDVTVSEYGPAWLNMNEIEAILQLSESRTIVVMRSGARYIVEFSINEFSDKFDLDKYGRQRDN